MVYQEICASSEYSECDFKCPEKEVQQKVKQNCLLIKICNFAVQPQIFSTNKDKQEEMSKAKISIRFFDDREVRALWDEENAKWWFSVLDIIAVLTDQNDYTKTRNYWKYLKAKLKKENSQVVSGTSLRVW